MKATLTSKGQITLPKEIRDTFGLEAGDEVRFIIMDDGKVFLIPPKIPITALRGIIPKPERALTLEEMDEAIAKGAMRGDYDRS